MTIVEFIQKHENLFKIDDNTSIYFKDIPPEILLELQNEVDLFKEAKLSIMNSPTEDGKLALTCLLYNETSFVGECKLFSMVFTPEVYKKEDFLITSPVLTPTLYDQITFEPRKHIIIPYLLENTDSIVFKNRETLHKTLDDMLDNPDNYSVSGYRGIMLRGILTLKQTDNPNSKPIQIKTK